MSGNATRGGDEEEGELDWDNVQVGFVFSSFSWGYMTTQVNLFHEFCEDVSSQILGGRFAELYGFKKVRCLQIQRKTIKRNSDLWHWDHPSGHPHVFPSCSSSNRCKSRLNTKL